MTTRRYGAREAAHKVLARVVGGGAYADIVLEKELAQLDERERPLATELAYGTLRWLVKLDWIIGLYSSIKPAKLEHSVLNALRLGVYQLLYLGGVPAPVAINETVNLIKSGGRKKAGFVNAVLKKIDSERDALTYPDAEAEPVKHTSVVYSHPEWMVRRWANRYGALDAMMLCRADLEKPPKTLRANTLFNSAEELAEALEKEGLRLKRTAFSPEGLEVLEGRLPAKDPRYYIQDEGSQLVTFLLAPKPGETVLDACAAPGGKTSHIAALMKNTGAVYALEVHPGRVKTLKDTLKRLGAEIVRTIKADSTASLAGELTGILFDAILIDAPCSGLGVLRRSPDIKLHRKEEDIKGLSALQAALLENLAGTVKKGGRIVYSVCTFEPEETDRVVDGFLAANTGFVLEDASLFLPGGSEGLVDDRGFLRTYPHRHNLDGFFAARLKRVD